MALYNYFSKLGTTTYNGELVVDIIKNVRFKEFVKKNVVTYYPYTVKEGERAETIAYNYYEDERYAWVVYLSNNIIDPYHQWPLSVKDFSKFIIAKYGSIETAQQKISFYRNNWYNDDSILTTSAYSALTGNLKKYWNPIIGYSGEIGSYERKKDDSIVETNLVLDINVNSSDDFIVGERVTQKTSGAVTGAGWIKAIKEGAITINNISGQFSNTSGSVGSIVGSTSEISRTVTEVIETYRAILLIEQAYWSPISFYDYEDELNESKKHIKLIDRQYIPVIEDQMTELLS